MNDRNVPGSTYRLQFNRDFTFADAERGPAALTATTLSTMTR